MNDFDIAVVGAGIVGTSAALWVQMRGHRVVLIDPAPPGSGTSAGNAGTLATYACLPVTEPSVLRSLPHLLFDRNSSLSISWRHALGNPRWMSSFLMNCRTRPSCEIAGNLAALLAHADRGLDPLIEEAGAQDLVVARGQLSIWSTAAGAKGAAAGLGLKRKLGVDFDELMSAEVRNLEPGLAVPVEKGVFYPKARHVRDPEALVRRFHARFTDLGGVTLTEQVSRTRVHSDGVEISTDAQTLAAGRVVIAAGAFSRRIAGAGTERLPLGCERGYHLMFAGEAHRLTRPVGWSEGGFYSVPMARGLRLAGTVEIAALDAPVNPNRLAYLARRGRELVGPLPEPTRTWLGYRPSMPDALPVLGVSPESDRIIHAFGHQHLGLTLGGISGRIVADLVEGRRPDVPIEAFRPDRRYAQLSWRR
ncbi:MAG: FAD-binding oxidoreductase [Gammaproteobacteria bacterium]|nr:FAD-binding oxidoreductase [Gammaproteobacteria bacterium]